MNPLVEIAILLALFLLNGFFAMAELAVVSSRRIRLQQMAEEGLPGAAQALRLADDPGGFLSAVQVGITLIGILSGAFGGATLGPRLAPLLEAVPGLALYADQIAVGLVVVIVTGLSVVLGELVPKQIALSAPETIARRITGPLRLVQTVFGPFVFLLERSSTLLLKLLGIRERNRNGVTEEEVLYTVKEGTEAGAIAEVERQMIGGVLALADRPVAAIMTPRPDVSWIDLDDEPDEVARDVADSPFSRIVVARDGDLGRPLGVVQKKDLLGDLMAGRGLAVEPHLREPLYVPESITVLRMLEMFRTAPLHLAFVVDEYGDFLGLVTLHDVLRAIAGDIPEEHDPNPDDIVARPDGSFLVDGRVAIDELADRLDLPSRPEGEFHTAAGLALETLARIPTEGDTFDIEGWRVEVVDMDNRRVDKLLFTPAAKAG
ncbi:Hemolysin [Rhodovulum sp. PH10]|uniref:hemolysin family protein n=1 Tax=Rhodovulum sp. PH10 TaxID=1187851 RepID=UPI00027C2318|nr:hemolysin family protein [Rhodovulum sp. PH10]EJW13050.1 Hemolysin [Rhodovulum sp. PH10]